MTREGARSGGARAHRQQTLGLLVLASAVPVFVAAVVVFYQARQVIMDDAARILSARAEELASELDGFLRPLATSAAMIAETEPVREFLEAPAEERPRYHGHMRAVLSAFLTRGSAISSLAIADRRGEVVDASDAGVVGRSLADEACFKHALAGEQDVELALMPGVEDDRPVIASARAVRGRSGDVVGVAIVYAGASGLWRLVDRASELRARSKAFAMVLDDDGLYVAHGRAPSAVLHPAARLDEPAVDALVLEGRFGANTRELVTKAVAVPRLFELARTAQLPATLEVAELDLVVVPSLHLVAAGRMATTPWTVFFAAPRAIVFDRVRSLVVRLALGSSLVILAALALGFVLTGRIEAKEASLERGLEAQEAALGHANKELEEKQRVLAEKNEDVERATRMKSEFLANMSHELRTPLNTIIGFSELLLEDHEGHLTARERGHLSNVLASGRHLLALINDILDLSKIEAGRLKLDLEPVDPGLATSEARSLIMPAARKRAISVELGPQSSRPVRADRAKLRQVLLNLLSNAVKFSPEGSRVEVSSADEGAFVVFTVRDQGPGIAPELLGSLFQPFVQGESAHVKKYQGTGLGLAISKKLVASHGGTIGVESAPGSGATFRFTIPAV